jgi:glycosyltransferase involved in cell wall biosynthesis
MQQTGRYLAAYRTLPRIVVGTAYMKALLIQNGVAPERIDILPPHFVTDVSDEPLSRPDESPPNILFAGRLAYEKGIPYLLQASQRIKAPHRLLIAGDGDLKESYQRLAAELGIADRVEFLGWLDNQALDAAYRRSAVAAMPTIMPEPFGKVGIEALTNGRPVVAFNVGGIADWLQDGVNGYLGPPRDIARLAARLERLLTDVDLAMELGRNGRAFVRQQYQPQAHADRLTQIFETVVLNGR